MSAPTIDFKINEPVEIALRFGEGKIVDGRWGSRVMYTLDLPAGHMMFLDMDVAQKINMLEPSVGERFVICKRGAKRWDLWLTPEAEKARAAAEAGVRVRHDGRPDWGSDRPAERLPQKTVEAPAPTLLERQLAASLLELENLKAAQAEVERLKTTAAASAPVSPAAAVPPAIERGAQSQMNSITGNGTAPRAVTMLEDAMRTAVSAAFAAGEYAKTIGYVAMPQFTGEDIRAMGISTFIAMSGGGKQR